MRPPMQDKNYKVNFKFFQPNIRRNRRARVHVPHSVKLVTLLCFVAIAYAQDRSDRFALVLKRDLPQAEVKSEAKRRGLVVTGSMRVLQNVVFVAGGSENELRRIPGVAAVHRLLPIKRHDAKALDLVNAPQAWNALGGRDRAGNGVKIGILDTGIDQNHPAFEDGSLQIPPGFPKCQNARGECAFTNSKVIVARSYVDMLNLQFGDDPRDTRPDDTTPRDRVGHGTAAAMLAAGSVHQSPWGTTSGVAPKAFLGNYKVFGSPGVNDVTFEDVIFQALEDAFNDGMDVVSLSLGAPAVWAPGDAGSICDLAANVACDWRADAVETAVRKGMTVVVSSGNDGDLALRFPSYTSIHTPGTAPSAITVGASTNAHIVYQTVRVEGAGIPADLQSTNAYFGNGPKPSGVLTAPLRDVARLGDNGEACSPLANGSLTGAIALISRGGCARDTKVNYAQAAGAVGVILYNTAGGLIFPMLAMENTGIPAVLVSERAGTALKTFIAQNPDRDVSLDPSLRLVDTQEFDTVGYFSSYGPAIGDGTIKPEVVAVGTDLLLATQKYDPNGDLFDASGYTFAQGTSFAAPLVAGAAALVKQAHPSWSPAQIKSAIVNTADPRVDDVDDTNTFVRARVTAVGAGKLDALEALRTNVTAVPATVSFGAVGAQLPSRALTFRNGGTSSVTLRLTVQPRDNDANARVTLSASTLTLSAGQSQQISVQMEGSRPQPGIYEGAIAVQGGGSEFRIPYLYQVGDGVPYSLLPLAGIEFVRAAGGTARLTVKVLDRYGVPVQNARVGWRATVGGGRIDRTTGPTDALGITDAVVVAGDTLGEQQFVAEVGTLRYFFNGRTRLRPTIQTGGVVNAGSLDVGQGLAPGSYITIYGRGLSEALRAASTTYLPVSLSGVSVSFDVPSKKISVPGRLHFVSDGQINVQIPWELQGSTTASMKVSIGDASSAVYSLAIADVSPATFEFADAGSGRRLVAAVTPRGVATVASPARRGDVISIYANGLGAVSGNVSSGEPSPASPLAETLASPTVTIGGRQAQVLFSGLAPFFVGLYQLNVVIPADTPSGVQPVVITQNGISSKQANVPIE